MKQVSTLAELKPGEHGQIIANQAEKQCRQRLLDLGFAPDGEIQCLFSSTAGDPRAYLVRGTVIALRQEDAERILLKKEAQE